MIASFTKMTPSQKTAQNRKNNPQEAMKKLSINTKKSKKNL
jgi:hypothetical protein